MKQIFLPVTMNKRLSKKAVGLTWEPIIGAVFALVLVFSVLFFYTGSNQAAAKTIRDSQEKSNVDCDGDGATYPLDKCHCDGAIVRKTPDQDCAPATEEIMEKCESCRPLPEASNGD